MEIQKTVIFNGVEYELLGSGKYYLSKSNTNKGRRGAKSLHVAIWEYHNGKKVPDGYQIHHKDFNAHNNDISNLECIPSGEHAKIHAQRNLANDEWVRKNKDALDKAREAAKKWHASEAGKAWHSEHGKKIAEARKATEHKCAECGKMFLSIQPWAKFCCEACGERWRGKHQRIEYTAICEYCGKEFTKTKYKASAKQSRTCSRDCTIRLGHKTRKAKSL